MLKNTDLQFLKRAIRGGTCLLVTGAGFSSDAKNSLGEPLPSSRQLASDLWAWLGYGPVHSYDGTGLPRLFDRSRKRKGDAALSKFLQDRLTVKQYPEWVPLVAKVFWHRIYTLNVDNLLELLYSDHGSVTLRTINALDGRYRDHSSFLEEMQYVKLNGSLSDGLDRVTFGLRQYAARSGEHDIWYDHFTREYSLFPTIFVGTSLDEPLFEQALEARGRRGQAPRERRAKSFLVSRKITPVLADDLREFNVVPIEATAAEFFSYLADECDPLPTREELLGVLNPELTIRIGALDSERDRQAVREFFAAVDRVEVKAPPAHGRSPYLLGAHPTWDDLAMGLDARREITESVASRVLEDLSNRADCRVHLVLGHRGAGKSTLIMRVALDIAVEGTPVFFMNGEDMPEPHIVHKAISSMGTRVLLVVDDAGWALGRLASFLSDADELDRPPVVLVALRANARLAFLDRGVTVSEEHWIRELTEVDIERVIDVLEHAGRLGRLTGKQRTEIRHEFSVRSRKQLLVALREATEGEHFLNIIAREMADLEDPQLKVVYLAACLATAENASLSRGQLLALSQKPPAEMLAALDREFHQLLIPGPHDRWAARHPVIATTVLNLAPRGPLAESYKILLTVLANDMDRRARAGPARRWFRLYKKIVNHRQIFERFAQDLDEARGIFDALAKKLSDDAHYWLQYGSLELEYGEVAYARHYIVSAEGIAPNDRMIRNAKGHLLMLDGKVAGTREEAVRLRTEGRTLLQELIEEWGEQSPYPWHTLLFHDLDWLEVWEADDVGTLRKELDTLRKVAGEAVEGHPHSDHLALVKERVERAYLSTANIRDGGSGVDP